MAKAPGLNGEPPPAWAAFDFDGTLVPGDSLLPFLRRVLGSAEFARLVMRAGYQTAWEYRRGGRDGSKAELLRRALAGRREADVADEGRRYADGLVARVRLPMLDRVRWHRDRGDRLILVSASLALYLEPFAGRLGFEDVIATRMEVDAAGLLSGRLEGPNVRGPEKARRLRQLIGDETVELWAYGDSAGDREMLAMANHPLLLRRRQHSGRLGG